MQKFIEYLTDKGISYDVIDGNVEVLEYFSVESQRHLNIPDNVTFQDFTLHRSAGSFTLPKGMIVLGACDISIADISEIPGDLVVHGYFDCYDNDVTTIPVGLDLQGSVYLGESGVLNNVLEVHNCGEEDRTVRILKLKRGVCIIAGCFNGTLDEFIEACNDKYEEGTEEAIEYIEKIIAGVETVTNWTA